MLKTTINAFIFLACWVLLQMASANEQPHEPHAPSDVVPAHTQTPSHSEQTVSKVMEEVNQAAPCGILENFFGDVQILDSTRTHLVDASHRAAISCGSWISVNQGWAQVRHQNGPHIHLGSQTFVQFTPRKPGSQTELPQEEDHLILYRGQIFVQAGGGEEEFRIISASGRTRVRRGKLILLFNYRENETQLTALENSASLENRFEPSRKVRVQAGEATELNFKLQRVIPTLPQAVAIASLKPKLANLRVGESEQFDAIRATLRRQSRKFASSLLEESSADAPHGVHKPLMINRKLASEGRKTSYLRHPTDKTDPKLKGHFLQKMVGGEKEGEQVVFPGKHHPAHKDLDDPAEQFNKKRQAQDVIEKKRLIEKLSQISAE
jgi:hypothetical protein